MTGYVAALWLTAFKTHDPALSPGLTDSHLKHSVKLTNHSDNAADIRLWTI